MVERLLRNAEDNSPPRLRKELEEVEAARLRGAPGYSVKEVAAKMRDAVHKAREDAYAENRRAL